MTSVVNTKDSKKYSTFACRDNESANVGLRGPADHVGHIILVSWRVEQRVALGGRVEVGTTDLDCLALWRKADTPRNHTTT